MFIIRLKFAGDRSKAKSLSESHGVWIQRGFDDGVFLAVGSITPNVGGAILAHQCTLEELQRRVAEDPFVADNLVVADIEEVNVARTDSRLQFLVS